MEDKYMAELEKIKGVDKWPLEVKLALRRFNVACSDAAEMSREVRRKVKLAGATPEAIQLVTDLIPAVKQTTDICNAALRICREHGIDPGDCQDVMEHFQRIVRQSRELIVKLREELGE